MSIVNFHDPTVIQMNLDDNGKPVSLLIQNETKQVVDGKIPLEGLPDEQYRIQIAGYVEISIKDKIDTPNKFKCDYTHGVLYFDQSINGTSINIDRYYSRGQFYIPSSRVWTKLSNTGEILETLDDAVERIDEISGVVADLDGSINIATGLKDELNISINSGNATKSSLDNSIDSATNKKTQLDDSVSSATVSKSNLDTSINSANTSKINLDNSISTANNTKSNLDSSISSGNVLKDNLDANITTGTSLKNNLDVSINEGNQLKTDLPSLVNSANTSKSNLDNSISTANTKKTELDTSISSADTINNTLSNPTTGNIKKATDINTTLSGDISTAITKDSDLKATIVNANTSKSNLDTSITNSGTAKSNLDGSISTANATKVGLDGSVAEGNTLKGELDAIITGTDYEQMILDVDSLKINKADKDYVNTELNKKVDNSRVLKDVPANADFTNTTYTAGAGLELTGTEFTPKFGTTAGTVTQGNDSRLSDTRVPKAHSHAIGDLPPYPTSLPANGGNSATTNGFTLEMNVPAGSKLTDTIYDDSELKYSELSSTATNMDNEGIYVNTEWKRKNNTVYAKSALLGISPNYNQIKMDYYDELGTTVIKSITWGLTYDGNDFVYKKDVI